MLLILLGAPVLLDSLARFALRGEGTPAPVLPTRHLVVKGFYRYVRTLSTWPTCLDCKEGNMSERDTAGIPVPPPLVYLVPLAVSYVFSRLYPVRLLPPVAADLLGGLLLALWLAVSIPAILTFRRARTSINPMVPSTALVVTGPFRFTRNPLYLGLVFGYSGVSILTQAWWAFVLLPVVLVLMQRTVIEIGRASCRERVEIED